MTAKRKLPTKNNLLAKSGHKCHYCRCEININTMTVDHVIPTSRGGVNRIYNMVASCSDCNSLKGVMDYHEFINLLSTVPREEVERVADENHRKTNRIAVILQQIKCRCQLLKTVAAHLEDGSTAAHLFSELRDHSETINDLKNEYFSLESVQQVPMETQDACGI